MESSDNTSGLPEALLQVMQSDDIKNIMSSFIKNSGGDATAEDTVTTSAVKEDAHPAPSGGFDIPPDLIAKLPAVISALSGMGIGTSSPKSDTGARSSLPSVQGKPGDRQRKALLTALRPYLSPRRKAIVDGLLGLEGLSGLLGALSSN